MSDWTPDTMPWHRFDRSLVEADLTEVVGGLALVESRADLYGDYLQRVLSRRFAMHPTWSAQIALWTAEEDQHGTALRRWFQLARPDVDVDAALTRYRRDVPYHDDDTTLSVRGSVEHELVCRCVIEALATTRYQALAARAREPVLQLIFKRLAADEARHYRFFFDLLRDERRAHGQDLAGSVLAMVRRLRALDDDQIMRASHSASQPAGTAYDAAATRGRLLPRVYGSYSDAQLESLARLLGRIVGLDQRQATRMLGAAAGVFLRGRSALLRAMTPVAFGGGVPAHPSLQAA